MKHELGSTHKKIKDIKYFSKITTLFSKTNILVSKNPTPISIFQTVTKIQAKHRGTAIWKHPIEQQLPVPISSARAAQMERGFRFRVYLGTSYKTVQYSRNPSVGQK